MRTAWALLLLCAFGVGKPDAEAKLKAKAGEILLDHAKWLIEKGQSAEAGRTLGRAKQVGAEVTDLEKEAAGLEEGEADPSFDARRKKAHSDAAKVLDQLGKLGEEPRFEEYMLLAAELDPSKSRLGKLTALAKKYAGNKGKVDSAGRIVARLREIDPEGNFDAIEIDLATSDLLLIKSADHAMVGYLSLPSGWKRKGEWPVLVAVDGAGSNFLGAGRNAAKTRGNRKFIVLAPCSLSNTNELLPEKYPWYDATTLEEGNRDRIAFDLAGLLALLEVAKERFGASDRLAITGFSGGGNLCYAMTVRHPARILVSAPACANFSGLGFRDAPPVEGGGPPVRILTGEKDPHREFTHGNKEMPGIEPQTDGAVEALTGLGFTNLRRTMLPGVGHSSCFAQVWEVADEAAR